MDGAEESASSPGRGRRLPESSAGNCPVILTDDLSPHVERWDTSRELDPSAFAEIRRRMMLEGCKWDPQVGDVATLAPFPIVLPAVVAGALARLAERLAAEVLAAEHMLADRPDCLRMLGLPRAIRRALAHPGRADPGGGPGHPVRLPPDRRGMADLRGQRRRARRLYRVVAVPPPDGTGTAPGRDRRATPPRRWPTRSSRRWDGRGPSGCCRLRATWKTIRSSRSWAASWPVAAAPRCGRIPARSPGRKDMPG